MPSVTIRLEISQDELLKYYEGAATMVHARAEDGRKVQFPAHVLRPYVTNAGISGRFQIEYNAEGKFQHIAQI